MVQERLLPLPAPRRKGHGGRAKLDAPDAEEPLRSRRRPGPRRPPDNPRPSLAKPCCSGSFSDALPLRPRGAWQPSRDAPPRLGPAGRSPPFALGPRLTPAGPTTAEGATGETRGGPRDGRRPGPTGAVSESGRGKRELFPSDGPEAQGPRRGPSRPRDGPGRRRRARASERRRRGLEGKEHLCPSIESPQTTTPWCRAPGRGESRAEPARGPHPSWGDQRRQPTGGAGRRPKGVNADAMHPGFRQEVSPANAPRKHY